MRKLIKTILKNPVLVLSNKKIGMLLSKEDYFIENTNYIDEFGYYVGTKIRPLDGEVGVWNNQRVVLEESKK